MTWQAWLLGAPFIVAAIVASGGACSSSSSDASGAGGANALCTATDADAGCGVGTTGAGGGVGTGGASPFCTGKMPLKLFVRFYDPAPDTDTSYGEEWVSIEPTRTRYHLVTTQDVGPEFVTHWFATDDRAGNVAGQGFSQDLKHAGEYDLCVTSTVKTPHPPGMVPYLASYGGVVVWERLDAHLVTAKTESVEGLDCNRWSKGYKCTNQRLCLDLFDSNDFHPDIRTFNVIEVDESGFDDAVLDGPTCPDTEAACKALGESASFSTTGDIGTGCSADGMSSAWGFQQADFLARYAAAKAKYGLK